LGGDPEARLKNALIPTLTVIGWQVGFLIGAAIVVETLFCHARHWYFGRDALSSVYILMQRLSWWGHGVVLANLSVDLLYSVNRSRIQYCQRGT